MFKLTNPLWFYPNWFIKPQNSFPKPLESFFETNECPDCGSKDFSGWEDGGHDIALECNKCHSKFGVQLPPFNLIERIGKI